MTGYPTIFEQKGHPTIKLYDDRISIKAVDYSNFRDFMFDKIEELRFYRPYDNSFFGLLYSLSPGWGKYRESDNYILRVKLKDGEHWDYQTTSNFDQSFVGFINAIQTKLTAKN
jgi:hypothetical protein